MLLQLRKSTQGQSKYSYNRSLDLCRTIVSINEQSDCRIIIMTISWSGMCYKAHTCETVALSPRTESIVHGEVEIIVQLLSKYGLSTRALVGQEQ